MDDKEIKEEVDSWTDEEKVVAMVELKLCHSKSVARRLVSQTPEGVVEKISAKIEDNVRERVLKTFEAFRSDPVAWGEFTKNMSKLMDKFRKEEDE